MTRLKLQNSIPTKIQLVHQRPGKMQNRAGNDLKRS